MFDIYQSHNLTQQQPTLPFCKPIWNENDDWMNKRKLYLPFRKQIYENGSIRYTDLFNPFEKADKNPRNKHVEAENIRSSRFSVSQNAAYGQNAEQRLNSNMRSCRPVHVPLINNKCMNAKLFNNMKQKQKDIQQDVPKVLNQLHTPNEHTNNIKDKKNKKLLYLTTDKYKRISPEFLELLKRHPAPKVDKVKVKIFENCVQHTNELDTIEPNFIRYMQTALQSHLIDKLYSCNANNDDTHFYNKGNNNENDDKDKPVDSMNLDEIMYILDLLSNIENLSPEDLALTSAKSQQELLKQLSSIAPEISEVFSSLKKQTNTKTLKRSKKVGVAPHLRDSFQSFHSKYSTSTHIPSDSQSPKSNHPTTEHDFNHIRKWPYFLIYKYYNFVPRDSSNMHYGGKRDGYYEPWDIIFNNKRPNV